MADWARFCDYFAANFSPLKENDGLRVWQEFITDKRTDERTLEAALRPMADDYARAIANLQPARRPTLQAIKSAYFKLIKDRAASRQKSRCDFCGGERMVWILSGGTEAEWPLDPYRIRREDFAGTELCPCPECGTRNYSPLQVSRLQERAMPMRLLPGDCRIPEGLPNGEHRGDYALTWIVLEGRQ